MKIIFKYQIDLLQRQQSQTVSNTIRIHCLDQEKFFPGHLPIQDTAFLIKTTVLKQYSQNTNPKPGITQKITRYSKSPGPQSNELYSSEEPHPGQNKKQEICCNPKFTKKYCGHDSFDILKFIKVRQVANKSFKTPTWSINLLIMLLISLFMQTCATPCFNDKLPSFIMDTATSNDYVWQTVIITKNNRYLFKGGYVVIDSINQAAFPKAPLGSQALAGLFDTQTNTFVWVKILVDEDFSSPIISAIALNYLEDTLVLAGSSTNAKKTFYFFLDPKTATYKYPSFTVEHNQDFHFLTSQSILLAGASRLYCSGISMQFAAAYTLECSNIGQSCSGTDNSASLDAIQYLVVDYATQTVLWHKIANSAAHFGAGSVASLIDVNPTASVNGQEHVIMGGGFSLFVSGVFTQWKSSLMSINPTTGQLDLVLGLQPTFSTNAQFAVPTQSDYPLIVHMDLYQTTTQFSIFILTQSRLMSTNGAASNKRHLCQITFTSATYTTVTSTVCYDNSQEATSQRKSFGTGIQYDPSNNQVHYITHKSNLATSITSGDNYFKLNLTTGAVEYVDQFFNSFISNAGVFTNKTLVTLTDTFNVFPGYFVGYQKSFSFFTTAPTALSFTKNSAIVYPYYRAETCSNEARGNITPAGQYPLTTTLSSLSNLVVGQQSIQVVVKRFYKTIDLQFSSLVTDNLCGTSSYTPLTVTPGSFHNVNLFIGSTTEYQCPFIGNTLSVACTDSNEQIYSIDESNIVGSKANIFRADGVNSQILIYIQDASVLTQTKIIQVTSTTPSGISGSFTFCTNLIAGSPPVGYDPCSIKTCLNDVDPISILKSATPSNVTYEKGSAVNNNVTILPFSLTTSCTYCTQSDIIYTMIVTPKTNGQSVSFILFNATTRIIDWTTMNSSDGGSFDITIKGEIQRTTAVYDTLTFQVTILTYCNETSVVLSITPSTLTNQTYTWSATPGSQNVTPFSVNSPTQLCTASDIVYTMSANGSLGGSISFLTFDSVQMLMNWYSYTNRAAETFSVYITATLTNQITGSPFIQTAQFILDVARPNCAQSFDIPTIIAPNLTNQTYIWNQTAGSYLIPAFTLSSTLSICTASDIVYSMSVTASSGGDMAFITFTSQTRLVNWYSNTNRAAETFSVYITATLTNQITGSPFTQTAQFILDVARPNCAQSFDIPTIIAPNLTNQTYIWNQTAGSYLIPAFTLSSTLSICTASDIVYSMSVTASSGGDMAFITFTSQTRLVNWYSNTNRAAETFSVYITATLTNQITGSPFTQTAQFNLDVARPNCAQSFDIPTIIAPNLTNQTYIWNQTAGSYLIPAFTVSSTLSICAASDIVYSMTVNGLNGGSSTFLAFEQVQMLVYWFDSIIRNAETFKISLTAQIINLNANPFIEKQTFFIIVRSPSCQLSHPILSGLTENLAEFILADVPDDGILHLGPIYDSCKEQNVTSTINFKIKNHQKYFSFKHQTGDLYVDKVSLENLNSQDEMNFIIYITLSPGPNNYVVNIIVPGHSIVIENEDSQTTSITKPISFDPVLNLQEEIIKIPSFKKMHIDRYGLVTVNFNMTMTFLGNISFYNLSALDISILNHDNKPLLQRFNWTAISFNKTQMLIQLQFENTNQISMKRLSKDKLKVQIIKPELFQTDKKILIQNLTEITAEIEALIVNNQFQKQMQIIMSATAEITKTVISGSFATNLFLSASMSQLWGTVNALQVVNHLTDFNIYQPANIVQFFDFMNEIAKLNLIDLTPIYHTIFPFMIEEDQNDKPGPINLIMRQVGTFFLTFVVFAIIFILYLLLKIFKGRNNLLNIIFEKLSLTLFWNGIIRNIFESYLDFTLLAFNNLQNSGFEWTTQQQLACIISLVIGLVIYILTPIILTIYLITNISRFRQDEFRKKFDDLIVDLDFRSKFSSNFIALFCFRRLILVLLIVFMPNQTYAQIQLITVTQQTLIIILGISDCLKDRKIRRLEFFNEFLIMIVLYHTYLLTDFVDDPEIRYGVGFSYIYCCIFMVAVNVFGMVCSIIVDLRLFLLKKRFQYRMYKMMKKQKQKLKQKALLETMEAQIQCIKDQSDNNFLLTKYGAKDCLNEFEYLQLSSIMTYQHLMKSYPQIINYPICLQLDGVIKNNIDPTVDAIFPKTHWVPINKMKKYLKQQANAQKKIKKNRKLQIIAEESNENSQSAGNFTFGFDEENPANLLMPNKDNSQITGNDTNRINNSQIRDEEFQIDKSVRQESIQKNMKNKSQRQKQDTVKKSVEKDMLIKSLKKQNDIKFTLEMIRKPQQELKYGREKREQFLKESIDQYEETLNRNVNYKMIPRFEEEHSNHIKHRKNFFFIRELQLRIQENDLLIDELRQVITANLESEKPRKYYNNYPILQVFAILIDYRSDFIERLGQEIPILTNYGEPTKCLWQLHKKLLRKDLKQKMKYDYHEIKADMIYSLAQMGSQDNIFYTR